MYHDRAVDLSGVSIAEICYSAGDGATVRSSAVGGIGLGIKTHVACLQYQYVFRVIAKVGEQSVGSLLRELSGVSEGGFDSGDGR